MTQTSPSLLIHCRDHLRPWIETNAPALADGVWVKPCQDESFGHFQSNLAMAAAKELKAKPRDTATQLADWFRKDPAMESVEIAGPGFVNLRFTNNAVTTATARLATDPSLGITPVPAPKTIVVDFSGPNVAKEMHVGHIRSTILGDVIARMLAALGHHVIRDNHLGDWGTQFGKMILGYKRAGKPNLAPDKALAAMQTFYQETHNLCENDPALLEQARAELLKLQSGDPENTAIWKSFRETSQQVFDTIYQQLDISFDHTLAESFYNPWLESIVGELTEKGIARESEGAIAVFFDDEPEINNNPLLIRKSDGAALYATTDLATLRHRVTQWNADEIIYVTDGRQQLHFRQLFHTARRWGYNHIGLEHVWFGAILGADKKPLKTRDGNPIRLQDLLDEAVTRAHRILVEKETDLQGSDLDEAARIIGIGALKYADLGQNRNLDYVFDWDRLLAFDGNTAPYLLNAYVRTRSILRKAGADASHGAIAPVDPVEFDLCRKLLATGDVVESACAEFRPHLLCNHLYETASLFHRFFELCPVLKAPSPELTASRLALCELTGRVLRRGMELLGIRTIERM